jgi:hypothetical protein
MDKNIWRYALGALMIILGGIALLQSLNLLVLQGDIWGLIFGVLFGGVGLAFLYVFFTNHDRWWAVIPGVILLALGTMMIFTTLIPAFGTFGGSYFLAGIGAAFWVIYLFNRRFWWAIIPGGVMVTLAFVALPIYFDGSSIAGGVFFLGLAATFGLVALLPSGGVKMGWAWIPAAVLAVMGFIIGFAETRYFNYAWPAAIILVGLFLLVRAFQPRR